MNAANKDVIYIDIDDEITTVIDKVRASNEKIVALVLPKRATMLQSIVNMKLLKRTADETHKKLVLITSEAGLMPLAGAVGIFVAKTLQSKPEIPPAPRITDNVEGEEDIGEIANSEAELDTSRPVGELAAISATDPVDETIEIDNSPQANDKSAKMSGAAGAAKVASKKAGKKLRIPNFESFRLRLILGVVALLLVIAGWYMAFYVWPKAQVVIKTDSSQLAADVAFTASTQADSLDEERAIIPAESKELKKTDTEKAAASGQKDMGTKASGEVTLTLTNCSVEQVNIPAGTGVSNNNLTFITQEAATLKSVKIGNQCQNSSFEDFSTKTVKVTAQNPGDQYNLSSGRSFTVSGYSNVSGSNESAMSGGTSRLVKIVTQADIDKAREKLGQRNEDAAKKELSDELKDGGYLVLEDTLQETSPEINSSPKAGEEGNEVTVTSVVTYTMLGVKEDALKALIDKEIEDDIDEDTQSVLSYGLEDANYTLASREGDGSARVSLQTSVEAGPKLDQDAIKREVAGKKKGQARELIITRPGIEDAEVRLSPFWVSSAPKNPAKISVVFETNDNEE